MNDRFISSRYNSRLKDLPLHDINCSRSSTNYNNIIFNLGKINNKILVFSNNSLNKYKGLQLNKNIRKFPDNKPYKSLNAPNISNDFYVNIIVCSITNIVVIGIDKSVYFYNTVSEKKSAKHFNSKILSLSWDSDGNNIFIGIQRNCQNTMLYNYLTDTIVFRPESFDHIISVDWKDSNIFCCGDNRSSVYTIDIRCKSYVTKWIDHSDKVIGLKWSPSGRYIISGGNDNKLIVKDFCNRKNVLETYKHKAAIKALSWCPINSNLFVSGGGTKDRKVNIWDISKNVNDCLISTMDTTNQVCFIHWSFIEPSEIISTHGYSGNDIKLWRQISGNLKMIKSWKGHSERILHATINPNNGTLITASPDELIKFWKIYPDYCYQNNSVSKIFSNIIIR